MSRGAWVAAAIAAGLAACSFDPEAGHHIQVSYTDYSSLYSPGLVQYAVPKGEMTPLVHSPQFGTGPGDPGAVAAAVPPPGWLNPPIRFTTTPSAGTPTNYKLVLIIDPAWPGAGDDATCANPMATPVKPGGGPNAIQATFCAGDRWVSHLVAYGPPAATADDPNFRSMLAQVSLLLFPPFRPDEVHSPRPCRPPFCS